MSINTQIACFLPEDPINLTNVDNEKKESSIYNPLKFRNLIAQSPFLNPSLNGPEFFFDAIIHKELKNNFEINSKIAMAVCRGEMAVTQYNSKKPILGSFTAEKSVIVSMYNKKNKKSVLVHIQGIFHSQVVYTMLKDLLKIENEDKIKVEIATLNFSNNETLENIKKFIQSEKQFSLKAIYNNSSLAIDSRTGKTFSISPFALDVGNDYGVRLMKKEAEILSTASLIYDGTNPENLSNQNEEIVNLLVHFPKYDDAN